MPDKILAVGSIRLRQCLVFGFSLLQEHDKPVKRDGVHGDQVPDEALGDAIFGRTERFPIEDLEKITSTVQSTTRFNDVFAVGTRLRHEGGGHIIGESLLNPGWKAAG